jgi:hypothetical protein
MAASAARAARSMVKYADPFLHKYWKSYTFQRGVQEQSLSPFEVNVFGADVVKGFVKKAQWMIMDRAHLVLPPAFVFLGAHQYVLHLRKEYLISHRD